MDVRDYRLPNRPRQIVDNGRKKSCFLVRRVTLIDVLDKVVSASRKVPRIYRRPEGGHRQDEFLA